MSMDWGHAEAELIDLAERLEVEVRRVRYEGDGGMCVVKGKRVLMLNDSLDAPDRVAIIARALSQLREIETVFVVPEVREFLEKFSAEKDG